MPGKEKRVVARGFEGMRSHFSKKFKKRTSFSFEHCINISI